MNYISTVFDHISLSGSHDHDVQNEAGQLYIPMCDDNRKPYTGQTFNSIEDAFDFYSLYGYSSGFGVFDVVYKILEDTIDCSCRQFVKIGLICRHMFVVMRNLGLKAIPQKYIVHRWLKVAGACALSSDSTNSQNKSLLSEAFRCITIADGNEALTVSLIVELKKWAEYNENQCSTSVSGKEKMFEMYYGSKLPTKIMVNPSDIIKTKGGGKRLKSTYERDLQKAKKPKRRCKKCGRMVCHDSRNCDKVLEKESDD